MQAACARLLHPSVTGEAERARQLRLLQVLFAAPAFAALAAALVLAGLGGGTTVLTGVAMVFGLGLLAPFALIATGRRDLVEPAAVILGMAVVAGLIAVGGGLASPLAAMAAVPAVEAGWIARNRRAAGLGLAAGGAGVVLGAGAAAAMPDVASTVLGSAWQWIVPLAYAATIVLRLSSGLFEARGEAESRQPPVEDIIGAVVLGLRSNGDVAHASEQARRLLAVAPEMLLGPGLFDRLHVADRVSYMSALADLREGAESRTVRLRVRMPADDGVPGGHYRSVIADMVADPEGTAIAVLRDDAATDELQAALARAKEAAEGATLARDHFVASVSHELRTPLNAIVGFSDVLANEMFGGFANDKQREYVGLIRQASGHLLSVVNGVLDISKLQSGTYALAAEPFAFDEAVDLCVALMAREAEAKAVALKTDIAKDIGMVHCDRRALQQVLINLISNAVKFTPSGEVKVTARRSGDRLDLTVSDTGIGMAADDLERVGTPFTQVQNGYSHQGTGLGLALVKGLVGLQGGGMSIESAPGAGTRVHVSLPASDVRQDEELEAAGAADGGANWSGEWNDETLRKSA
ncbi:sensor histidine kinase [Nitratireductor sp. GCM10026969]|uniref:sensor histidine kinase n=1 Tax=Nitratireductor sp. GCM10026969 TaxID=3252645 RepID=UPI00361E80D6